MNVRLWNHGVEYRQEGFASFAAGTLSAVAAANRLYFDLSGACDVRAVFDFQEKHWRRLDAVDPLPHVAIPYTDSNGKWYNGWTLRASYNMGISPRLPPCWTPRFP